MRKVKGREATTVVIDPLVGSVDIAKALAVTSEFALRLMRAGEFGEMYDVGTGSARMRPRVRKSEVDRWIAERAVKRVSA